MENTLLLNNAIVITNRSIEDHDLDELKITSKYILIVTDNIDNYRMSLCCPHSSHSATPVYETID